MLELSSGRFMKKTAVTEGIPPDTSGYAPPVSGFLYSPLQQFSHATQSFSLFPA